MNLLRYNHFMMNNQPHAIIVCGPNGVGKTTLALEYQKIYPFTYLSADAIAFELNPTAPEMAKIQAGRLFIQRIESHIAKKDHLIIESTLSGKGFQRILQHLKAEGYYTVLSFVFLQSPEACIARVAERTLKGGHFVPALDVKRRYHRAMDNFWHLYKKLSHEWCLYYNSNNIFHEVCVEANDQQTIIDENLYQLFLNYLTKRA